MSALHAIDVVPYAVPFFVLTIVIEMVWARRHDPAAYEPRDTLASLLMGLGSTVAGGIVAGAIVLISAWLFAHRVVTIPAAWFGNPWALAGLWIGVFVLDDANYYAFHRSAHRVRWFWASHVNHHSSQHYNLSTALRQPVIEMLWAWVLWLPLVWFGFHPVAVALAAGLNLLYQFWIHTESVRSCGVFERFMNTPSHHRAHHGSNPRYIDKNYGGWLIVWDKLFGSFEPEHADDPVRYGLVHNIDTYHPLKVITHEWRYMLRQAWRAKGLRRKLAWVFGPPEYAGN